MNSADALFIYWDSSERDGRSPFAPSLQLRAVFELQLYFSLCAIAALLFHKPDHFYYPGLQPKQQRQSNRCGRLPLSAVKKQSG